MVFNIFRQCLIILCQMIWPNLLFKHSRQQWKNKTELCQHTCQDSCLSTITPYTTTGQSPAQLWWGLQLRSHLTLLHPDVKKNVWFAQNWQKIQHDQHAREHTASLRDGVFVRRYGNAQEPRSSVRVIQKTGPVLSMVKSFDETIVWRHQDQIRQEVPQNLSEVLSVSNFTGNDTS